MDRLVEEVLQWNTPCIGSYLLWRFTMSYCNSHANGDAPVALLHFLATAILTKRNLSDPISNRRANLQSYVRSFEETKNTDVILGLQETVRDKREYTLAAIDVAITSGLLVWDIETGKLYPLNPTKRPKKGNNLKASIVKEGEKADILGKWFAEHSISTIATYLKVVL